MNLQSPVNSEVGSVAGWIMGSLYVCVSNLLGTTEICYVYIYIIYIYTHIFFYYFFSLFIIFLPKFYNN